MTYAELLSAVRAALDETEQVARRAGWDQPRWTYDRETFTVSSREWSIAARKADGSPINDVDGEHIALHDPAAVLRRVAADRKLLDLHDGLRHSPTAGPRVGHRPGADTGTMTPTRVVAPGGKFAA